MSDNAIYIVDDNEAICHSIKFLFDSFLNLDIKTFQCANIFLEQFSPNIRACLIIDLDMPSMSGIDLMKRVKKMNQEIRIIVLSGHGTADVIAQSLEAGADAFIVKPFKTEHFLEEVKTILQGCALENNVTPQVRHPERSEGSQFV